MPPDAGEPGSPQTWLESGTGSRRAPTQSLLGGLVLSYATGSRKGTQGTPHCSWHPVSKDPQHQDLVGPFATRPFTTPGRGRGRQPHRLCGHASLSRRLRGGGRGRMHAAVRRSRERQTARRRAAEEGEPDGRAAPGLGRGGALRIGGEAGIAGPDVRCDAAVRGRRAATVVG